MGERPFPTSLQMHCEPPPIAEDPPPPAGQSWDAPFSKDIRLLSPGPRPVFMPVPTHLDLRGIVTFLTGSVSSMPFPCSLCLMPQLLGGAPHGAPRCAPLHQQSTRSAGSGAALRLSICDTTDQHIQPCSPLCKTGMERTGLRSWHCCADTACY